MRTMKKIRDSYVLKHVLFLIIFSVTVNHFTRQTCTQIPEKKREIEVGLRPSMPRQDSSIFLDYRGEMVNNVIWKVAPKDFNGEQYSRKSPFVFVGGHPRSGTTLMRSMFDVHQDIHCGEETHIIPKVLGQRAQMFHNFKSAKAIEFMSESVINAAIADFIAEIIVKHGPEPKKVYCDKDPFNLSHMIYLSELFPNAKFIFMLRDGRASAHSVVTRKVGIGNVDITNYRDVLTKWNEAVQQMYAQCLHLPDKCLMVKYEDLVLHPRSMLKHILNFVGLEWDEVVMEHEKHMDHVGLSGVERSTDQVVKPLYIDSLNAWVGHLPADVETDIEEIAPMIKILGYSTNKDPYYGRPDWEVTEKYNKWLASQDPKAVKNAPPELTEEELRANEKQANERKNIKKQIEANGDKPRRNKKSEILQALGKSQANQLPPHF